MEDELRACRKEAQGGRAVSWGRAPLWELRFGVCDCAPHDTPLWELLPRDLQEHVGRFLAQKLLWVFLSFGTPKWLHHRMSEDEFERIVINMRRACPVFHRTLRTVFQLSVPTRRWTHHETFARGLVRLAWELEDRAQIDAQGASHISKCWFWPRGVYDVHVPYTVKRRLEAVAKQAYEAGSSRVLPEHYLQVIEQRVPEMMLEERSLRWVHGQERRAIENVILCVLNARWRGRTEHSQMRNRKAVKRVLDNALERLRVLQQGA